MDVTVVIPAAQVVHGTTTVVSNGVDGMVLVTDGVVLLDGELEDENDVDSAATNVLLEELEVVVSAATVEVTGTVVVMRVEEIVVFMLAVTTLLVVMVHGEVMVMVDIVVMVLIVVTVLTAGVLVVVTTEPLLSVEVIVVGATVAEV